MIRPVLPKLEPCRNSFLWLAVVSPAALNVGLLVKDKHMKKVEAQRGTPAAPQDPRQPGAAMLRLLNVAELKQVSGGRSGPSPRGSGH